MSAIWNDPHFRKLTGAAQRAYLMLVTQHDISSAGTLALTMNRWAGYAIDTTSDALSEALSELESHRFIVVDGDLEELLVRKFVKWDRGYTNEKRRAAIIHAAKSALSPRVRETLALELRKLGMPDALSDGASDTPRGGYTQDLVTEVSTDRSLDPEPEKEPTPIPLAAGTAPPEFCPKHPDGTDKPCGPCKTARLRRLSWEKTARATAIKARDSCPRCRGSGWIEDENGNPARKCPHIEVVTDA